jgi:hypothetical protein
MYRDRVVEFAALALMAVAVAKIPMPRGYSLAIAEILLKIDISQFLPGAVAHEKARLQSFDGPRPQKKITLGHHFSARARWPWGDPPFWGDRHAAIYFRRGLGPYTGEFN